MEIIKQIPPFTRFFVGGVLIIATLSSFPPSNSLYFIFSIDDIFHRFQIWRIFTGVFFMSTLSLSLFISLLIEGKILADLENLFFKKRLSNLVFIFILAWILSIVMCIWFKQFDLSECIYASLLYLFSKVMPDIQVVVMFVIPMRVAYLPFVRIILHILSSTNPIPTLIGSFVGHIIFFFLFLLPVQIKRPIFKSPNFLVTMFDKDIDFGNRQQQQQHRMQGRGHHF